MPRLSEAEHIQSCVMPALPTPRLSVSTGEFVGNTVIQILKHWKYVPDRLQGVCFDTTSSNAGAHTVAITVIQQAFDSAAIEVKSELTGRESGWLNQKGEDFIGFLRV